MREGLEFADHPAPGASLLELVDNLLDHGVVIDGDVVLGLAGVDLVYLRLSVLLCSVDRLTRPRTESED